MHELPEENYIDDGRGGDDSSGQFHIDCAYCHGTGVNPATMKSLTHSQCPVCHGDGMLELTGKRQDFNACRSCGGTGREPDTKTIAPCRACQGRGVL